MELRVSTRCLNVSSHTAAPRAGVARGTHSRLCIPAPALPCISGTVCCTCNVKKKSTCVKRLHENELWAVHAGCRERCWAGCDERSAADITSSSATVLCLPPLLRPQEPTHTHIPATRALVRDSPNHRWAVGRMLFINRCRIGASTNKDASKPSCVTFWIAA